MSVRNYNDSWEEEEEKDAILDDEVRIIEKYKEDEEIFENIKKVRVVLKHRKTESRLKTVLTKREEGRITKQAKKKILGKR